MTYRQATTDGCSTGAPALIDQASRTNWACDQASGVAENVPVPGAKPGLPDGGKASQTCSGSRYPSLPVAAIAASRLAADRPAASSYSPRSPAKMGQIRPMVDWLLHGLSSDAGGKPMSQGAPVGCSP